MGNFRFIEGDPDHCFLFFLSNRRYLGRIDEGFDSEMIMTRMNFRSIRVGIHGLESNSELPDFGEFLAAIDDPANASHVGFIERIAVVPDQQSIILDVEGHALRRGGDFPPGQGIFGVLQDFEDEVGAVIVEAGQEQGAVLPDALPVIGPVLFADRGVVARHRSLVSWNCGRSCYTRRSFVRLFSSRGGSRWRPRMLYDTSPT